MHRTRIKICGITRKEDALAAAEAGADAIGIVLQPNLPRSVTFDDAAAIIQSLPPFVAAVGLFVDADASTMRSAFQNLSLTAIQLHGQEPAELLESIFPIPAIKALHVAAATLNANLRRFREGFVSPSLVGLVLDTDSGGGSGLANDWSAIASADLSGLPPWIAAGGLTPSNVKEVILKLRPWAVDVSSGVEISKREKSPDLIKRFIQAVREADAAG